MASPELAIAQAALSATLFRADPTSLSRPAVDAFFPLLSSTVARCSRPNVQKCKTWIVDNVVPSTGRTAALAKFLLALSKSLELEDNGLRPSLKRKRLHILYVVNDVLFHAVTRHENYGFASKLEETLPALVATAAAFDRAPKHIKRVENLIAIWEEKQYFAAPAVSRLKDAVANGAAATAFAPSQPAASLKLSKDAPYILPSVHGDSSAAWYDLPAATWLPHLVPNSTKPMLPDLIRPVQLAPGPADKDLVTAVQTLMSDVDRLFLKDKAWEDDAHASMNDLGARIVLDEITGKVVDGDTYYGWSRQFCNKMKARAKNGGKGLSSGRQSRSRSRSIDSRNRDSRSASPPAFKRRRFSPRSTSRSSGRRSRGGSRSRSRNQRARSRSRNRSEDRRRSGSGRRRSYSRSASPPQRGFQSGPRDRPLASSDSYPKAPPYQQQQPTYAPPPQNMPPMAFPGAFQGLPPYSPLHNMPFPPPPPLPMGGNAMQTWPMNPGMSPQMMGGWVQPPPPPPPPMHQMPQMPQMPPSNYHHNNNGRGRGGYRGRGRGGYDHGY